MVFILRGGDCPPPTITAASVILVAAFHIVTSASSMYAIVHCGQIALRGDVARNAFLIHKAYDY